jgi:hypothetical protein
MSLVGLPCLATSIFASRRASYRGCCPSSTNISISHSIGRGRCTPASAIIITLTTLSLGGRSSLPTRTLCKGTCTHGHNSRDIDRVLRRGASQCLQGQLVTQCHGGGMTVGSSSDGCRDRQ